MTTNSQLAADDLVRQIVDIADKRLSADDCDQAKLFIRQFYRRVPLDELQAESPEDLYFAAIAMLQFLRDRPAGMDKLRVYNPDTDEEGWSSSHTVIDLNTGDRPFLVDSLASELNRRDIAVHLLVHPAFSVLRDEAGSLQSISGPSNETENAEPEAVIRFEISRFSDPKDLRDLEESLARVLSDVRRAVTDWRSMRAALTEATNELKDGDVVGSDGERDETVAFLEWLEDDHFTFLGYRKYDLEVDGDVTNWAVVPESSLGILSDVDGWSEAEAVDQDRLVPEAVLAQLRKQSPLMITKTERLATVHRSVHMDSIGIKRYGADGSVIGTHRFLGLFTSTAYNRTPREIPLLRQKIAIMIARAGFRPASHDGKALINILESYPRDELFQISDDELFETALGILHLQMRPRLKLFVRRDAFERFMVCLVFIPRERYDSSLRYKFEEILNAAFDGKCEATYTHLGDEPLARLTMLIRTTPGEIPDYDLSTMEERLGRAVRGWEQGFAESLIAGYDEQQAAMLERRYARAFPAGFRDQFTPRQAVTDVAQMERAASERQLQLNLYRPPESTDGTARFKIYNAHQPVALSDVLPMIEHMGLKVIDEFPYRISPRDDAPEIWIHDFGLVDRSGRAINVSQIKSDFQDAFARVWAGEIEDDGFNQLVTRAAMTWREVVILRAYCKYLRQAKIAFSQDYMERTLGGNPSLSLLLVKLFKARFDPVLEGERKLEAIEAEISAGLDHVENLDQDRIIRRFVNAIQATVRTNFFQKNADGEPKAHLSFKMESRLVDELPLPRPHFEIFVYSPRMEGVHLRGGRVARGGMRWSDRPEDFRTEILGLMKAQMVKNAVIVPVGSKGGFVLKKPPTDGGREAFLAEGVACYSTLIRGMLDITDNMVDGAVVPPADVARHDPDDPYLVVAADKGTATFSDIANGISAEYGFWLGDAFASGGSVGYDHKKMGITARGAWESVKRNFRELGLNTQTEPFTVIGVGDMSGDVFGNGMLLSDQIRLVGAFNHLHIFLDPTPDEVATYRERKRLFELPRSGWADYDESLLSPGGGVFERKAKSIPLTDEIRSVLALDEAVEELTPNELIAAMLRAPIDLLWNGGIGTYVKAATESHADVGDRANDAVRVDANDLRCRVVGEGGNLGLTQLARIAADRAGVRLNSDAIDNSAGVDCSDHEVNIKILLNGIVSAGDMTLKQRDSLLAQMTDEVADQCLEDNYRQTQGITVIETMGVERLEQQNRVMQTLERQDRLDREIEFLPDEEAIAELRQKRLGLTRPEISVLMAYVKNTLYDELLESDFSDDPYLVQDLSLYFPLPLRQKFGEVIAQHPLRREIIATRVANSLVNRASLIFPQIATEETGQSAANIARAYVVARDSFDLRRYWTDIEALDNKVPAALQTEMILDLRGLMEHAALWFIRNQVQPMDCATIVNQFRPGIELLTRTLTSVLPEDGLNELTAKAGRLESAGVPGEIALAVGGIASLQSACDIVDVSSGAGISVETAAATYFEVGRQIGHKWLRVGAQSIKAETHWQRQAIAAIVDDLFGQQRALTLRVVSETDGGGAGVTEWLDRKGAMSGRREQLFADLQGAGGLDLAMLAVANRQLRGLISG